MSVAYTPRSIFWASFGTVWTVTLLTGMGFLWLKRDLPFIKVRGIGLSFAAIGFLHVYYLAIQYAQMWTSFAEQIEYWVMGIYLPIGIALFHASNSRFLHVAKQQRRFAGQNQIERINWFERRLGLHRFRYTQRMMITVGIGMGIQIFFTVFMYLLSRKFHPSFGIPGTEVSGNPWEVNSKQAVGWEWWPSIVWQLLWSWVFAPVVLYRARNIHDTLGWRTQTIACCIANLPATPMWILSLYVPAMSTVDAVWVPPEWIATSILFLEFFTVFVPCWQAYRHKHLRQDTLNIITAWERTNPGGDDDDSQDTGASSTLKAWTMSSTVEKFGKRRSTRSLGMGSSYSGESLLSMGAMECLLQNNPEPLRLFSALRDFSGENVAFLTAVAEWKRTYPAGPDSPEEAVRDAYTRALRIYTDFISIRDADFPLNISFQEMARLEAVFEKAARILFGRTGLADHITPFATALPPPPPPSPRAGNVGDVHQHAPSISESPSSAKDSVTELRSMVRRLSYWGHIPEGFDMDVFDQTETNIKYLVLTNTWPKFVQERRSSDGSLVELSGEEHHSSPSWATSLSRMIACGR